MGGLFEQKERVCAMKTEKQGFRLRAGRPTAILSAICFALCIPLQILGYADSLKDPVVAGALVFLPLLSAVLMIAMILKFGRDALWLSLFAVCIGVLGFVVKLLLDPRETSLPHHVAAAALYLGIIVLWALTVLYVIRTKWVLTVLFLIPFFKHILMNDLPVLLGKVPPVPASTWLKEGSMLSFMLALSLFAASFEKTEPAPGSPASGELSRSD